MTVTAIKVDPWKAIDFALAAIENDEEEVFEFLEACKDRDVDALKEQWPDFFEDAVSVTQIESCSLGEASPENLHVTAKSAGFEGHAEMLTAIEAGRFQGETLHDPSTAAAVKAMLQKSK